MRSQLFEIFCRHTDRHTQTQIATKTAQRLPVPRFQRPRIGVGEGGVHVPPKIREKYFSGNYYIKFGHFSGKNHVKFGNFVNFSGKYNKNSGILIIFRARIM